MKVYPPQVKSELRTTAEGIAGSRTWEFVLVPETSGTVEVPPLTFSYFDPAAARIVSVQTQPLPLRVEGGTVAANRPLPQAAPRAGSGALPLRSGLDRCDRRHALDLRAAASALLLALALAVHAGLWGASRVRGLRGHMAAERRAHPLGPRRPARARARRGRRADEGAGGGPGGARAARSLRRARRSRMTASGPARCGRFSTRCTSCATRPSSATTRTRSTTWRREAPRRCGDGREDPGPASDCSLPVCLLAAAPAPEAAGEAASAEAGFRAANEQARAGDFPKALAGYAALAHAGHESASLYWNWAQAASGRGAAAEALWALLRARELDPADRAVARDVERLREALNLDAAEIAPEPLAAAARLSRRYRLDLLAAVLLGASLALHAWTRLRAAKAGLGSLAGVALALGAIAAAGPIAGSLARPTAVVVQRAAPLFDAASPDAEPAGALREGEVVPVLDASGEWLRVEDNAGARGWARAGDVWRLDGPPLRSGE